MDSLKNEFEEFLCERNDVIDNAAYNLAAVIFKNERPAAVKETAVGLLKALLFQPADAIIDSAAEDQLIAETRKILVNLAVLNPDGTSVLAGSTKDLPWSMRYIGEIVDAAEDMLAKTHPVCHPYLTGWDSEKMCIDAPDCKNKCALRCGRH